MKDRDIADRRMSRFIGIINNTTKHNTSYRITTHINVD